MTMLDIRSMLTDASRTLATQSFPRVTFDECHREAYSIDPDTAAVMNPTAPADNCYSAVAAALRHRGFRVAAHHAGAVTDDVLRATDVYVIAHPSDPHWEKTTGLGSPVFDLDELECLEAWVRAGGGLVVLAEHEQDKYGSNINELLGRFGVRVRNTTVVDPVSNHNAVAAWPLTDVQDAGEGIAAGVRRAVVYRAGTLECVDDTAMQVVLRAPESSDHPGAPIAGVLRAGAGRVVVTADSDLFSDDSVADGDHADLFFNLVAWAAGGTVTFSRESITRELPPEWLTLKAAVSELRLMQSADGHIDADSHNLERARELCSQMGRDITALAPRFAHNAAYHEAVVRDIQRWVDEGFGVPDFYDSLALFRPDQHREDGVEHLVVFPMYTQNGNPDRVFEAVWIGTCWPEWVAEVEAGGYANPAFVPITFVDFTAGYDTHSAVLFPETVAVREVPTFHWGAIFCDREAARFRVVTQFAADVLKLQLPPDAELLLRDQRLAQETFVLWDLVHDRTHSHGDLPFDPFMIKQRMPFWLYALEELRCDLNTYVEMTNFIAAGVPHAPMVKYAIVFDRLFRFPISGNRTRNYDGLGGQILFAHLHKERVLRWTDNTLHIDWDRITESVGALASAVNALYHDGIERSRVGHWLATYQFVADLVHPHPASAWNGGKLDLSAAPKVLVDSVLDDEFPLNVFYEALRKKLAPAIEQAKGITA